MLDISLLLDMTKSDHYFFSSGVEFLKCQNGTSITLQRYHSLLLIIVFTFVVYKIDFVIIF